MALPTQSRIIRNGSMHGSIHVRCPGVGMPDVELWLADLCLMVLLVFFSNGSSSSSSSSKSSKSSKSSFSEDDVDGGCIVDNDHLYYTLAAQHLAAQSKPALHSGIKHKYLHTKKLTYTKRLWQC